MIPQKLKPGDEIRIIAPSRSLGIISQELRNIAAKRLKEQKRGQVPFLTSRVMIYSRHG